MSPSAKLLNPPEALEMRKLMIYAALLVSLGIAACHTVAGAGRDVSSAGNAVTDTAHDAEGH